MKKYHKDQMVIQFKDTILRQKGVLETKIDWYSLCLGFLLGLGVSDKDAISLAKSFTSKNKGWINESTPKENDE